MGWWRDEERNILCGFSRAGLSSIIEVVSGDGRRHSRHRPACKNARTSIGGAQMSKAAKRKASRRGAKRVRTQPVLDCVTRSLIENGIPLTQRNWIEAAYLGDKSSIDQLDAEEVADAPDGFEVWPVDDLPVN